MKDAAYLGEHLPMPIRGLYFENWDPSDKPLPIRSRTEIFSCLSSYLARNEEDATNAEEVTMAILLLGPKATYGDIENLQHLVPTVLIDLWPPALRAA